jgi:hypothetical protein
VQRGGTSWWFSELARHPDVHRAPGAPKEVHFFDAFSDRRLTVSDIARYHAWFARPPGGVAGEWTPCYIYDPWTVPALAEAAPAARVLLLLRDPVDRFHSALEFQLRRGLSHSAAVVDAFHRGLYAEQVARLLAHFARDRVLVLTYEAVTTETAAARLTTAEFLALDPAGFDGEAKARRPRDRRAKAADELPDALLGELIARYRDDITALARLLPGLDLGRWPTASTTR